MWILRAPAAVLGVVALSLLPTVIAKPYPVHLEEFRELHNASQVKRQVCPGNFCGYSSQLCCTGGSSCITDLNMQAQCVAPQTQAPMSTGWTYWTSTWVETNLATRTQVYSTWVGPTAQATPTPTTCAGAQSPCGSTCCDSGYYCRSWDQSRCEIFGGSSSPGGGIIGTVTPSAPLRPTSSTLIIVTATSSPTVTMPFQTPIATGVNGTLAESTSGGGGLSGGAIAGIVIGVILGIILLLLICLYCCARAAFDGIAAILGFGKKRKHTHEETYIEEHHHSSGGAAAGGRRWYGQPSRPSRPPKKSGGLGGALGMGAALGGLALALGLKRKHDKRHDDKSTTISGSSAYYSDYTSSSEFPL